MIIDYVTPLWKFCRADTRNNNILIFFNPFNLHHCHKDQDAFIGLQTWVG